MFQYLHLPVKSVINRHNSHGSNPKTRHNRSNKISKPLRFLPSQFLRQTRRWDLLFNLHFNIFFPSLKLGFELVILKNKANSEAGSPSTPQNWAEIRRKRSYGVHWWGCWSGFWAEKWAMAVITCTGGGREWNSGGGHGLWGWLSRVSFKVPRALRERKRRWLGVDEGQFKQLCEGERRFWKPMQVNALEPQVLFVERTPLCVQMQVGCLIYRFFDWQK